MTFELYELTVRPLQYMDKACYLVQMRQTNSMVHKSLKQAQEVSGSLPQTDTLQRCFKSFSSIIRYSQMLEQYLCR